MSEPERPTFSDLIRGRRDDTRAANLARIFPPPQPAEPEAGTAGETDEPTGTEPEGDDAA